MNIPHKDNPVLLDRVIQSLQESLKAKLKWLDYAFGRSFKVEEPDGEKTKKFPAVYTADGEYLSVLPDDTLGNFLFFEIQDPITINRTRRPKIQAQGAIIFWLRLDTIYPEQSALYIEEIKFEILAALASTYLPEGRVQAEAIYEDHANIYKGYDTSQIDGQYLLYPYYGFRLNVNFEISELCLVL